MEGKGGDQSGFSGLNFMNHQEHEVTRKEELFRNPRAFYVQICLEKIFCLG